MELLSLNLPSISVLVALGLFSFITWKNVPTGLSIIALLLPSYLIRFTIVSVPATFLECMIILVFIIWLLREKRWKHINLMFWKKNDTGNRIPTEFRLPLILFLLSAAIAAWISPAQPQAFGILKAYFIEPLLYLIVMAYAITTKEELDRIMAALGCTTIAIALFGCYQYLTGTWITNPFWADPAHRRITTFFGYPNASSLFVAPIAAYYLGSFHRQAPLYQRLFSITVILAGIATVLMAKTAGAALALGIVIWVLLYRVKRLRTPLIIASILTIIGMTLLTPIVSQSSRIIENISRNHLDLNSSSLEIRINQWRETAALLGDHPIRGAGLANYQQALTPYHRYTFLEIYLYPHMIFLNTWVELGLLGLIATVWLLIVIGRSLKRALTAHLISGIGSELAWGIAAAWMVILIHGLVDVPYFKNDLSVLWMIFIGAVFVLHHRTSQLAERHTKSW